MGFRLAAITAFATLAFSSAAFASYIPDSWDGVYIAPHTGSTMLGWGFGKGGPGSNNPPGNNNNGNNAGNNSGDNGWPFGSGNDGAGSNDGWFSDAGGQDSPFGGDNDGGGHDWTDNHDGDHDGGSNGDGPQTFAANDDVSTLAVDPPVAVPEPLTLSLFGAGLVGAMVSRRRRKAAV